MSRALGHLVILLAALACGFFLHRALYPPNPATVTGTVTHISQPSGPTIEQVQKLANLVTLRVPISDVQTSKLEGFTGSLTVVVAVHGDVEIATDLSGARFESMDSENRSVVLVLPAPNTVRPRLDHEKTRVVGYRRGGLWSFVNGQAGEETLTNRAMARAQEMLAATADQPELKEQARAHAEEILREFFSATGWEVSVKWLLPAAAPDAQRVQAHP